MTTIQKQLFRESVLDHLDATYEQYGDTPEVIIISDEMWQVMEDEKMFETVKLDILENLNGESRIIVNNPNNNIGFIGMVAVRSAALDDRGKAALLLSKEAFMSIFDRPKDL